MNLAEQALAKAVKRRMVREVVLKDEKAFEKLHAELTRALSNAWDDAMREGIVNALDRLRDLGAGAFTKEDGAAIMRILEASVGADALQAAMREPIINLSDAIYRGGAEEIGRAAGVSIAFMRPDLDALDILKTGNLYWVGNSWNTTHQDRIARALNDYFEQGMTREALTQRFAEDFAGLTERGRRYWELLADHTATKTREMGRVTGYDRAGVEYVQVRAHLDDKTTEICRHMHGRVIAVSKMRTQRDDYLEAASKRNEPAMKETWAMHGADADFSATPTSKLGRGTASPPYHFRCRTITVMFVPPRGQIDQIKQKVTDREALSDQDFTFIRDRANQSSFLEDRLARAKFVKHRANIPTRKLRDYMTDARALIADTGSRVAVSTRQPIARPRPGEVKMNAIFSKPQANANDGRPGHLVTVVSLEDNTLISHHWRDDLASSRDLAYVTQKLKGFFKWLIG